MAPGETLTHPAPLLSLSFSPLVARSLPPLQVRALEVRVQRARRAGSPETPPQPRLVRRPTRRPRAGSPETSALEAFLFLAPLTPKKRAGG